MEGTPCGIREEKSFPDRLEERIAFVVNAINTELKSITLLHMDNIQREAREIRDSIKNVVGDIYLPSSYTFREYCNTLYNISLVARETRRDKERGKTTFLYSLTDAGEKYGYLIADLSLKYAVDNGISMFNILGTTHSSGNSRAPFNRIRILKLLIEKEMSESDLENSLELDNEAIMQSLRALQSVGFVEFSSIGAVRRGKFRYEWIREESPQDIEPVRNLRTLTKRVAELMAQERNAFDYHDLSRELDYKHPSDISSVLAGLEIRGFVRRKSKWVTGKTLSKARILEKGIRFVDNWIAPVEEILIDGSPPVQKAPPDCQRQGIVLYTKASPQINKKPREERIAQMISYLKQNPDSTSEEIARGLKLSKFSILNLLRNSKCVKTRKTESEIKYSVEE